jgi:hypothetical protein
MCHRPLQNLNTVDSYSKMSVNLYHFDKMQHVTDSETSTTFIQDAVFLNHFGTVTHNTRCILSRRRADLLRTDGSLYHFDTLKEVSITSTRCHTHSTLTSSYQNNGNAYHVDTSYSFEPELNPVPSKGKVGVFVTSTSLNASSTPRNETRSSEMSVIVYNFSTQGAISYERPCKLNPHTNWHQNDIAYCAQHCA